jgi:hypothetical protein
MASDYRLIWLGTGTEDIWYSGAKAFAARLAARRVPHLYKEYRGAHVMPVFRFAYSGLKSGKRARRDSNSRVPELV